MARTLVHRGPDEAGFHEDDQASLGMRRLSILDIETGHQPICNEDKTVWAVCNGEIYNFETLRADLLKRGHRFVTHHSDVETIVHLYEDHGPAFVEKLNGMFAIALWDAKTKALLLIRDRLGVKPLFYALSRGQIIFGSEIKALLDHPALKTDPCFAALYHYFTLKNIPAPLTAFQGIYSLLPGEALRYEGGRLTKTKWWTPRFGGGAHDEGYYKAEISRLLEDATRLRMRCDVPFGAYLSGGVDSSSIVALMTRFSDRPVKTFSLGYQDQFQHKECDLHFARQVAKQYKTEHHEYVMSHKELLQEIPAVIKSFDQPFSGTISTFFLTKLIKKHVTVALSGDGADELFGSYLSHRTAGPMSRYAQLAQQGRLGPEDFLRDLYLKSGGKEPAWRYHLYLFTDEEKAKLLSPRFLGQADRTATRELIETYFEGIHATDPLNRILEMEFKTQFPDQVLAFADALSMAHSVEIRSPFLDYRFVELAASIPGDMKIRDEVVKSILKDAMRDLLPKGIAERPKEGFVLPIFDWMTHGLEDYMADILSPARLKGHGLLNQDAVTGLLSSYRAGNRTLASRLWNLMMFQVWWEQYFQ